VRAIQCDPAQIGSFILTVTKILSHTYAERKTNKPFHSSTEKSGARYWPAEWLSNEAEKNTLYQFFFGKNIHTPRKEN